MPDAAGAATDSAGRAVLDPTKNVLDLVEAAIKRQDDMREMEASHLRELMERDRAHQAELRAAESARIDAIRAVDVGAVQRASEVAGAQAEALRNQVAAAAAAQQTSLAAALDPIQKDIADLRRAQYEAQGVKAQTGETRLNLGAVLGALSVLLVLIFGTASIAIALLAR